MHILQAGPPPELSSGPNVPLVWLIFTVIPAVMIFTGMVMGFRALHDIRYADGALGGSIMAAVAAGLLPALIIVGASGAAMTQLGALLTPAHYPRSRVWLAVGAGIGVWLSFMMMRGMHRGATGWTPPVADTLAFHGRSLLATAAIVLTIAGAAVMLLALVLPAEGLRFIVDSRKGVMLLNLPVILAGLICGVLSHRETAGKTCSWICGALFAVLLLLFAS